MTRPWTDPRAILRRHGLQASRAHSQNFLVQPAVATAIAEAATRDSPALVVELGPGLGALSLALLQAGSAVFAIEKDRRMIEVLQAEYGDESKLQVVPGDATAVDYRTLAAEHGPLTLAGNLPYAVTGAVLRNVVEQSDAVRRCVFMVQREVRDRLSAAAGTKAYGALSVFVAAQFEISTVARLKPGAFFPVPKVHSAVVALDRLDPPRAVIDNGFTKVVNAAFGMRRKMLRNALQDGLTKAAVEALLDAADIAGDRRGETLSVEEFATLGKAWESLAQTGAQGYRRPS